jgi:hypothetical protein
LAHHPLDAVADEAVRGRHALLGIAGIVTDLDRDLLAEHAALGVDVVNRLLRAVLQLGAEGRVGTRDRAGNAELDVGMRRSGKSQTGRQHKTGQSKMFHSCSSVEMVNNA